MSSTGPENVFDRTLYFGLAAFRHGYIRSEDLFMAVRAWIANKSQPIGSLFVELECLYPDDREILEHAVADSLAAHQGDAMRCLFDQFGPLAQGFEQALRGMKDEDVDAALDRLESLRAGPSASEPRAAGPMVSSISVERPGFGALAEPDVSDDDIPIPRFTYLDPPDTPDTLGMLGHYRIVRLIGEGACGSVFLGFDTRLHRLVAVKVLKPSVADSAPPRRRFLREARAGAQVDHPNVVRVYGVEEKPLPYLVMEFVQGETLHHRIERTGPLPLADIVEIARQTAEGLAAAHEARLVHRDIKPANILIADAPAPRVKVTDFSLVRVTYEACISESDEICGTPLYMSPEQARGRSTISYVSDLFSLGSVIYTMTTGQPPFQARDTMAILRKVIHESPRPIRELAPDTPAWLVDLVDRLMAKRRSHRFERVGSARNVANYLRRKQLRRDSGILPAPGAVSADPLDQDTTEFDRH